MYCPNCGTQNENDARFCGNCGRQLGAAPAQGSAGSAQAYPPRQDQNRPFVPNHLVEAILVTIFCCLPAGIVAIVYAAQVNSRLVAGDIDGALTASKSAWMWIKVSFWVVLALIGLYVVIFFLGLAL